jgi:hypothetical protein
MSAKAANSNLLECLFNGDLLIDAVAFPLVFLFLLLLYLDTQSFSTRFVFHFPLLS